MFNSDWHFWIFKKFVKYLIILSYILTDRRHIVNEMNRNVIVFERGHFFILVKCDRRIPLGRVVNKYTQLQKNRSLRIGYKPTANVWRECSECFCNLVFMYYFLSQPYENTGETKGFNCLFY